LADDYDSKRDRWNGYVPEYYNEVHARFEKMEEQRKRFRLSQTEAALVENAEGEKEDGKKDENDNDDDELKQDGTNAADAVASVDPKTRTAIRNLRIREDTV
jgi:pre-mRNA-processing factor SLU7